MGYYTNYTITLKDAPLEMHSDIQGALSDISGYNFNSINDLNDIKWYDHDKNMIALSLLFPGVLFTLDGIGEEKDDVWRTYYKNGKSQSANAKVTVTYDKFKDESSEVVIETEKNLLK